MSTGGRRRRVLGWALAGLVVVVALVAGAAFSPLLDVGVVEVQGAPPERVEEVRHTAGVDEGDPILTIRTGAVAARLRDLPWVDDARVVRDLPDTVRLEIVPRVTVGWVTAPNGVLVVDATGHVVAALEAPPAGVPELRGIAHLARPGGVIRPVDLPAAAGALGPELRVRTTVLTLLDGSLTAQMWDGPEVRYGPPRSVGAKARVASAVLAAPGGAAAAYVDVSVPTAPVTG